MHAPIFRASGRDTLAEHAAPLSQQTILCFAPDPWAGLWRNRHQIMTRLARQHTVLYVEPRIYWPETLRRLRAGQLRLADFRAPLATPLPPLAGGGWGGVNAGSVGDRPEQGGGSVGDRPEQGGGSVGDRPEQTPGLWLYHDPYYAPFAGRLTGGPLTAFVRRRAMLRTLRSLGAAAPMPGTSGHTILWLLHPYQADLIGQYGEKLVVYHVIDEYSAYPWVLDKAAFLRQEETLLRRADLVIVTAPGLLAKASRHNSHSYLVPNAVDYAGFQKALLEAGSWKLEVGSWRLEAGSWTSETGDHRSSRSSLQSPISNLQPPTSNLQSPISNLHFIGYAGALNEKVDYGLLAEVARARPAWQIVLIGPLGLHSQPAKADPLRGLPNVYWPGRLPLDRLPGAIASLDVCLLPYELNEWTANIDSLKLYEYLACGRPVVSTDVPASRSFAEVVRIARDPADFIAQIEAALAEDDPAAVARRKAIAAANTWDHRVARIEELLAAALARREFDRLSF